MIRKRLLPNVGGNSVKKKKVRDMGGLEIATSTVVLVDRDMQETSDASF